MENEIIRIHASRKQYWQMLLFAVPFLLICVWLGYQLITGKNLLEAFLIFLFFGLLSLALAVSRLTTSILLVDEKLTLSSFFIHQSLQLNKLQKAELHSSFGKYPYWILTLEDRCGAVVRIQPDNYEMKDFNRLAVLLQPYIFITRVEKNFNSLNLYIDQYLDYSKMPKMTFFGTVRSIFLYVFLPAILITCAVVMWAILTKQPGFH